MPASRGAGDDECDSDASLEELLPIMQNIAEDRRAV